MLTVEQGAESVLRFARASGAGARRCTGEVLDQLTNERMVVAYSLFDEDSGARAVPEQVLIGKCYSDDTGVRAFRGMQALTQALARLPEPPLLAVPEALFYDAGERFLVQRRVPGTPYTELVKGRSSARYFHLAGQALAQLHTIDVAAGEPKGFQDHLREMARPHPMQLAEAFPEYRALVEDLLQALSRLAEGWGGIQAVPLHRDFHLRQLFHERDGGRGRVWLIDWDLFARGDAALDVAYFVAYLKTHLSEPCTASIDAFLAGYCAERPASVLDRVPAYEAFNYLRRACRRLRLRDAGWRQQVGDMLMRAESVLGR